MARGSWQRWHGGVRWFAAEFVVVVAGILVAFAINSAYESSKDRERETGYLRHLIADLHQTERLLGAAEAPNAAWDGSLDAFVASYRASSIPAPETVRRWIADIQYDNPVPVLGTAEALVQTGDLQLIEDLALRSAITTYLSRTREYTIPWLLTVENDFLEARTGFRTHVDVLESEKGDSPYPLDVARLLENREAYFLLSRMLLAKRELAVVRQAFRDDARAVRTQLAAAAGEVE